MVVYIIPLFGTIWRRVLGPTPTERLGLTAIFLDPPYSAKERDNVYNHDSYSVANDVRAWATKNGNNPMLRIALCGYDDFAMPNDWILASWQAAGGYESQGKNPSGNRKRERIWFSPHCAGLNQQLSLFGDA